MTALPVHLLTGFLGSGKTTLLSSLLRQKDFADTAVVINELGDVGLDHLLVTRGSEEDVVLLDSGCLCCALGNSLQETLESLHFRRARGDLPSFARVVVETTLGLDSAIVRHYRLGSIVTVVDALHGSDQLERFIEARRQVAMADRMIVSKGDLASAARIDDLVARLASINPHAVRVPAIAGNVAAAEVLVDVLQPQSLRRYAVPPDAEACAHSNGDPAHARDPNITTVSSSAGHDHLAEQRIRSTSIRLAAPLEWPRYADWVQWTQRTFGDGLLRMKGAVRMADGAVNALHAVMRLFSAPSPLPALPIELGDGVIVLITQDLPPSLLAESRQRIGGV